MMLYGERSLTKRRGKEEETIALMVFRITTVNLLIYYVTAIFQLR